MLKSSCHDLGESYVTKDKNKFERFFVVVAALFFQEMKIETCVKTYLRYKYSIKKQQQRISKKIDLIDFYLNEKYFKQKHKLLFRERGRERPLLKFSIKLISFFSSFLS